MINSTNIGMERTIMLFGTSGIRGDAKKFDNQFCFDIGRSFAKFLSNHHKEGGVAIGMDPRESSQRIKDGIARGILYEKRIVSDEGLSPSPAMNYILIADHDIAGSIMITGSHIRADFNGLKFFINPGEILKEHEKEIEHIYEEVKDKIPFLYTGRAIIENRANEFYRKMLLGLTESYPRWKIILDCGNGSQSGIMPSLFKELGMEPIMINNDPIPEKFIARDTEVKDAANDLILKVKDSDADLGIAYDGDGDRVVFVDSDGNFISGDYTGSLIAKYSTTDVVITPVSTSQVVDYIGKSVIRTKVGSPYVVEAMEKYGSTFGFEANGGGISKEVMLSRDAGSATIKILNILNNTGMTLRELVNTLPRFFIYKTKVDCPMNLYNTILEKVRRKFENNGSVIEEVDGLKIWKNSYTWTLFRPSLNAPEFRVFAESLSEENAKNLCEEGIELVNNYIKQEVHNGT